MTLLFVDGFDHYATADITKKWSTLNGAPTINASGGRRSSGGLSLTAVSQYLTRSFAANASWVIGFAIRLTSLPPSAVCPLLQLLDAGTLQCDLRVNIDGTLSVTRNGTAVTGGTSANALSTGTDYYIELKVTIADSIGASSCVVKVNNVAWLTVATGQDLKNTANASASQVRIGNTSVSANSHCVAVIDDVYVCDSAGSTNNDFLGDVRVDTLYPTSDGNYSQFTCSTGTTHYALVDETTPNTTDYNDGSTVGHRDSYGMGNLAALTSQTVYGVQVNAAILKDDAGAKSASTMVRSGSTNGDGASAALGTSQVYVSQVYEQDPAATAAWTETTVNAMEAGVIVTA